jgi:hypothetical protein
LENPTGNNWQYFIQISFKLAIMRWLRKALERRRHGKQVRELRQASQDARIAVLRAELDSGVTPEQSERDKRYLEGKTENGKK